MEEYLLLAAAESCGPAMIPALLDPGLDPGAALAEPPADTPPAARRRCADRSTLRRRVDGWLRSAEQLGLHVLTPRDPCYPPPLRDAPLRPLALFARGDRSLLARSADGFAIVGSRTPTAYGRAAVDDFGDALAGGGIVLWSGLAAGIDAGAHRASLSAGVPTVAVVAGGLDVCYPAAHRGLVERIVDAGGVCLSEAPPGRRPQRGHFPRRNRIIALATGGVLVVEAGIASGSLHTARFAAEAGVPVWAVPGPYTSERSRGCHRLIADGAGIACDPESLLRDLGVSSAFAPDASSERADRLAVSADQRAILEALALGPRPSDLVRRESRLDDARFVRALVELLEQRHIVELTGGLLARRS